VKKIFSYFGDSYGEFKKISWPNRDEVTKFTAVTVATVLLISLFLWLVDSVLMRLIRIVIG